jgi:hypothetical protein
MIIMAVWCLIRKWMTFSYLVIDFYKILRAKPWLLGIQLVSMRRGISCLVKELKGFWKLDKGRSSKRVVWTWWRKHWVLLRMRKIVRIKAINSSKSSKNNKVRKGISLLYRIKSPIILVRMSYKVSKIIEKLESSW